MPFSEFSATIDVMRTINTEEIAKVLYAMILKAGRNLTPDCTAALERAEKEETGDLCKYALGISLENGKIAARENLPVCQDTGLAVVILEIGQDVHLTGAPLETAVNDAVRASYGDGYFRKSCCDPLTRVNTGNNTPAVLYTEITEGENVTINFLPKGFGSENMSKLYMLTPAKGVDGIIESIVDTVKTAGSRPCPPVYIGVGIGGTFDKCAFLAKKALMRPVGSRHPRADVAEIEKTALERINALRIGAQGFGGDITALGVSCEILPTHIAGLPVAVNVQCHCVRCEKETI